VIKKIILLFIIFILISGAVFAREQERANNSIVVGVGLVGVELSYERMFNRYLSAVASVSYTELIFMNEFTASGKGRFYPFGGIFFMELGVGYTYGKGVVGGIADMMLALLTFGWWLTQIEEDDIFRTGGLLIQPGIGWKIGGKTPGLVMPISMGINFKRPLKDGDIPDFMPYFRIGIGYSF